MKKLMTLALAAVLLSSCGGESADKGGKEESPTKQTREQRIAEIDELEGQLRSRQNQSFDASKPLAMQMVREYRDFVTVHSKDSLAPHYLFKAADLSVGLGKFDQALGLIDGILAGYPQYERRVEMMLFKGFILEQHMNQHARAVEAYEALIKRYPNHRLAKDAQASIDNLTLTEEELIEKFKKMNPEDKES